MSDQPIRLKSYRVKGGAIVTVTRGDRVRRYRVSLLRLARINWLLLGWPGGSGCHRGGNCFDIRLPSAAGYAEAMRNLRRYGGPKARALFPYVRSYQ